jgi:hypothetical protein
MMINLLGCACESLGIYQHSTISHSYRYKHSQHSKRCEQMQLQSDTVTLNKGKLAARISNKATVVSADTVYQICEPQSSQLSPLVMLTCMIANHSS